MAEFTEVVKQARRMCKEIADCNECPLDLPEGCKMQPYSLPDKWDVEEFEKAADIVMDWAEKHPEPRYPSWYEWQKTTFPDSANPICPKTFMSHKAAECDISKSCGRCMEQPIPADIAEKLGIKPMGESNG